MGDFFKSAFSSAVNNLTTAATTAWNTTLNLEGRSSSPSSSGSDNPFIGQVVELGGKKIRIDRLVAEGGFGFVFKVRELGTGQIFALKRLIAADKDAIEEIENEISVLQQLQPHPHIMHFVAFGVVQKNVYLLLSEFCGCGSVLDLKLPIATMLQMNRILFQTASAVQWMHSNCLIHRDLKIENILFDNRGLVKLCDFGSATDKSFFPDMDWTPIQRSIVEDEMQRKTTPMYRPPEILDTYLSLPITTSMDVWAYGCIIFMMKFARHPFEDSAKLRIINGNYTIPGDIREETDVHVRLIKSCLKIDPRERLTMDDVITIMEQNFVDLNSPVVTPHQPSPIHIPTPSQPPAAAAVSSSTVSASTVTSSPSASRRAPPPPRPPPPKLASKPVVIDEANLLNLSLEENAPPPAAPAAVSKEHLCEAESLVDLELLTSAPAASSGSTPPMSSVSSPLKPTSMAAPIPRPASSSSLNGSAAAAFSAPKQPHYARSFFSDLDSKPAVTSSSTGVNPKVTADHFEDLLQGFTKTANNANTKLAELKKQELLENGSLDPVSLKVREWKENKTSNVRALIGSLHSVVWPECKWTPVGMHQLVDPADVRKHYLRACLAVHPDKLRGDSNEKLANMVFVELNTAWSEFEKQNKL